jgi:hypothetical protein
MKTAKSLVYGGELIDAIDCTYEDFKRLAPLCPNCSSPVHLKAGGDRLSIKGKPYKIPQHWAHFAGKSAEEVATCELRVNGYSDAEREKIQRVARGQREKWIRRWLWRAFEGWVDRVVFCTQGGNQASDYATFGEAILSSTGRNTKGFGFDRFKGTQVKSSAYFRNADAIDYIMEGFALNLDRNTSIAGSHTFSTEFSGVDIGMHKKLLTEIFQFLKLKKNDGLLETFIEASFILSLGPNGPLAQYLTLPALKRRGFLVLRRGLLGLDYSNQSSGLNSPSVARIKPESSCMPYSTQPPT